ncbi:Sensor protein lytS [Fibrella aestuarina BUZ 2]|uniref:Sensor protein lytS n=1 Tax=Fibrella aestuarina BUZ 2 TaxID=1166018 RepID=I0KG64_9BACT|nr:sensor histidine kinase [Fibrella aestuarina]CCH03117.1 Sensor protein lytS [Fibrella aestuarina BUZ 2]
MTIPRFLLPVHQLVERSRPAFFSRNEWWFHLALALVSFPIGNYLFFGQSYLSEGSVFIAGSLVGLLMYGSSVVVLTLLVRRIMAHYTGSQRTLQRTLVMIGLVSLTAMLLNLIELYVCSRLSLFRIGFTWQTIKAMWLIIVTYVGIFCLVLNLFYAYTEWKKEQVEIEQLRNQALQRQFDALKGQVNPHFLFNSLSSISALIGEDNALAERFVDDLAKVYRYMLQAGNRPLVPLGEELTFVGTYAQLLRVRYGAAIRIELPVIVNDPPGYLPPLSLQTLVDNALEHNSMSANRPLVIQVRVGPLLTVAVVNSLQRKKRHLAINQRSLSALMAQFQHLITTPVRIDETDATFSVTLPLVHDIVAVH